MPVTRNSGNGKNALNVNLFSSAMLFIISGFMAIAPAQAESPLKREKYSKVRVLHPNSLPGEGETSHLIGLHIKMQKKWKTYWRRPGDSGVPPFFDWKKSENLKSVKILWPAPTTLKDPYGSSIGYKGEVVFPIMLEPEDRNKPINVNLVFGYGACLEICIPEERTLSFQVPGGSKTSFTDHKLLMHFLNRVPKKVKVSQKVDKVPVVNSVKSALKEKTPYLDLSTTFPDGTKKAEIFIEVSDGFFVADPKEVAGKSDEKNKTYRIDLTRGDKVSDLIGKTITVTLVSDIGQSETKWVVQ